MIVLHYLSVAIGIVGIAVIAWGVAVVACGLVRLELTRLKGRRICRQREALRHQLGSYLLLGLEFLIAADIIGTITHPTLEEVGVLGGIVAIRTVISVFLNREIANSEPCDDTEPDSA